MGERGSRRRVTYPDREKTRHFQVSLKMTATYTGENSQDFLIRSEVENGSKTRKKEPSSQCIGNSLRVDLDEGKELPHFPLFSLVLQK